MNHADVLIVGAGHGGAAAATALRQRGFAGSITMVGEEPDIPYDRPSLSKDYLSGEKTLERISLRPATFWVEKQVSVVTGVRITRVDAERRLADGSDGCTWSYGKLIWAAGGRARRLDCPGANLDGVFVIRNREDVDQLVNRLHGRSQIVVVGAGYIGLEAAAALRKLGKTVTVLERGGRVLSRVAGEDVSRFIAQQHAHHGVTMRFSAALEKIHGEEGAVTAVELADGERLPADVVIVGIGIHPAVDVLERAGALCSNGVVVDEFCKTTLRDVLAIGDCAAHVNRFSSEAQIRLESVQNANDMAATAAASICGVEKPYAVVPWFWSNQYDLKLQTVGLSSGHDQAVVRGDPSVKSFSVVYLRKGRIVALDCINAVKDYVQGRALVERGMVVPLDRLADASVPLKELVV